MNLFKIILIAAFTLLLGCSKTDEEKPEQTPPPAGAKANGFTSQKAKDGYNYTISVASKAESVYVYYSVNNVFPVQDERFFQLDEGECLRVKGEQFNNLSIFASKGSIMPGEKNMFAKVLISQDDDYMPLCNATLKCNPDNYSISPREANWKNWLFIEDEQLIMFPVKRGVFDKECDYYQKLDKWMEFKVRQLGEKVNKEAVDDSSKAQIEEWTQ